MRSRSITAARCTALALAIALAGPGCDLNNPGRPVPDARRNFPIAVALTVPPDSLPGTAPTALLVANANFDLRYASGTLQSYSIAEITTLIASRAEGCPSAGRPCLFTDAEMSPTLLGPGGIQIGREVQVGSHMDGLALSSRGDRAYIPARSGTGGLTWVAIRADGTLFCGSGNGVGTIPSCDAAHRSTNTMVGAARGLTLPSDPVALAVRPVSDIGGPANGGDYIVMAHRNGAVSLFLDGHVDGDEITPPMYVDTITGVPNDIVSIEADDSGLVWLTSGALASARQTRELVGVQVIPTLVSGAFSASLAIARRATMRGVDDGLDSRDVHVDPARPQERLWVLSRRPESIITVDFTLPPLALGEAPLGPIYPVGFGPSRLESFDPDDDGPLERMLVASCYDAHALFFIDLELGPVATVAGMDGPFEVAIDEFADRAYVVDFRSSVIWVVDLSGIATGGSPVLMARLGDVHAPSAFGGR